MPGHRKGCVLYLERRLCHQKVSEIGISAPKGLLPFRALDVPEKHMILRFLVALSVWIGTQFNLGSAKVYFAPASI
jgi:hypothetical protein